MAHRSAIDDSASLLRHLVGATALAAAPDIGADVLRHRDAVVREALARTTLRALAGRPGTDSGVEFARLRAHAEAGPPGQWPAEDTPVDRRRIANDVEDVDDGHVIG